MAKHRALVALSVLCLMVSALVGYHLTAHDVQAQSVTPAETATADEAYQTAEGLVDELYRLVTFDAGTTPDWDRVRSLFMEQAIVVLRTSREETTVFSVDTFVGDFVSFIERADVKENGFIEKIVRTRPMVYGDMAHVLVLYEAIVPESGKPPQQGVDSFQLVKMDGRWWIVSITNELPRMVGSLPSELEK